jgi:hypothetical protein
VQTKALTAAVNEVPKAHRDTLQFLVFHLSRVVQHQDVNLVRLLSMCKVHESFANAKSDDPTQPRCCLRAYYYATHGHPARTD